MFSRREWLMVFTAIGLIVVSVWMDLRIPALFAEITTLAISPYSETGEVWRIGGLMLLFILGSIMVSLCVAYLAAVVSSGHSARLRRRLFTKVNEMSAGDVKNFKISSLITRSTNDVTEVRMFTALMIQMLVRSPIMMVWASAEILAVSAELTATVMIGVGAVAVLILALVIIVIPRFKRARKLTDRLNQVSRETLSGIRVVRAYNAEEFEREKFEKENLSLARNNIVANRAMGVFWPFISFVMASLTVAIFWVGSHLLNNGSIPPYEAGVFFGNVQAFSQYAMQILWSFMMLLMMFVMMPSALVSARRINEVLKTSPSIKSGEGAGENFQNGDIKFTNVTFKYPDAESAVIKDVNITIKRGSTVAFIGGTGSGKSTLVNLLPRIYDTTDGEITIGGTCVRDMTIEELNNIIGYIPQKATLFGGSVRYNVTFGRDDISDESIWRALEISQARNFVEELDNQLDYEVSQGGTNLSGGQKQRLSIARVVACDPKIYIFDDTFSALDYKTDKNLRATLKKETRDATVLIVAQRIGTIKDADMIYVIDNGSVVAGGKHKELLKTSPLYKEIALSQLSKEELQ